MAPTRKCPSCGAAFLGQQCSGCGTWVAWEVKRHRQRPLLWIVPLALAVGLAVGWVATRPIGRRPIPVNARRELIQLSALAQDGTDDDFALYFGYDRKYRLAAHSGKDGHQLWETAPTSDEDATQSQVVVDPKRVYWIVGSVVRAFDRPHGKLSWQASLATEMSVGSARRAARVGQNMAVLQRDGTLMAFRADSGTRAWNHQFLASTGRLNAAGTSLWLPLNETEWALVDGETGQIRKRFSPSTGNARLSGDARWSVSRNATTAAVAFGVIDTAVACLSLTEGRMNWTHPLSHDLRVSVFSDSTAQFLASDRLWWSNQHDVCCADLTSGDAEVALHDARSNLVLLEATESRLIVGVHDSAVWSLAAYDRSTGARLWTYKVQAKSLQGGVGISDWDAIVNSDHIILLQALHNPARLTVDRLALATGLSDNHQESKLVDSALPSLQSELLAPHRVVFNCGTHIIAVSLDSGAIELSR